MKKLQNILAVLIVIVVGSTSLAQDNPGSYKFYVDDPANRNTVTFKSEAPLEDIIGTSNQIMGYINFDPKNPNQDAFAELNVPISSLNTGIPLRDEHLRSASWLNAEAYPDINLKLNKVIKSELVQEMDNARTFELIVAGDFTLNGVTKKVEFPARITYLKENEMTKMRLPGDLLAVRTSFSVPLADYDITGPEGMKIIGAKVSKSIDISVNLFSSTIPPSLAQKEK